MITHCNLDVLFTCLDPSDAEQTRPTESGVELPMTSLVMPVDPEDMDFEDLVSHKGHIVGI